MKFLKKLSPFVLVVLLVLAVSAQGRTSQADEYVTVVKDGVNVRSAPSNTAEIHWEVFKNFPLKVIGRKGEWVKTEDFEGDTGWIYGSLLQKDRQVIVKVKKANLRVGPGKNYEISATALYGVVFTPGRKDDSWVQVTHQDGTRGWLHESLIWP
ncbi:MAG: SH3 domain-containing protein [Proteobacteria bacterium]|nr:SH3 domain-containing protein [Pseudomonadota bacterium]MBU1639360.1 SH3 domain-containing protein [Pseudomonadota bacterium]